MSEPILGLPNPPAARVLPHVRLFAVLGTWQEDDVVADTISNAMTQGCERVYLVDNASTDRTVEAAVAAGAIAARIFQTDRYDEQLRITLMNNVVDEVSVFEGDDHIWWLFLDADEFPHGPAGLTLLDYLRTLDETFRVVGARFFNHFPGDGPGYRPGRHPIDFQPLCEELVFPMCSRGHRKHPLQRFDREAPPIECGRGFHLATSTQQLFEPMQPVFLHHFPFRERSRTQARLEALWRRNEAGVSRADRGDDAAGHMLPRFRSLDAVYSQDWARVEHIGGTGCGVTLRPWQDTVDAEHTHILRWTPVAGAWRYGTMRPFAYGDDVTYQKGMAFLAGHGVVEDWGCGFAHARRFAPSDRYVGVDGCSPYADIIADLTTYRSTADCIFMRHVLEHNADWRRILGNAIHSFRKRMVLIVFTPLSPITRVIATSAELTELPVPDIAFRREDLVACFGDLQFSEESVASDTQYGGEHIFYLRK